MEIQVWQVYVAAPTTDSALGLLQGAVEAGLAAGGHVAGPVTSVYSRGGETSTRVEWQAVLKTTADRYQDLEEYLVEQHEWINPEITVVRLTAGLHGYLAWVRQATRG